MSNNKDLIKALKDCGAIQIGEFILSSGKKSNYYVDIKKASTRPDTLKLIGKKAAEIIKSIDVDNVGGVELGGVPIATAVSLESGLPMIIIRKSSKEYGTGGRLVGQLEKGERVILLEDVTTSGGSVKEAVSNIQNEGGYIDTVITVVDREEGAEENLKSAGIKLITLIKASDLV
ncbi:orotate phosphoribosyltransferase [Methanohalobium evestigatum Z-7303]|uniref:Orotate phosphoribosyltransferase n=1 Tax=Methanohalobium evestigatum (strain ATCC BAA-1072 / DSM 3721 / NBRC 107634 / OCM 161 / Z-7303) TaxID=644295 RepID=D7E8V4_METEZ|nr:orotate phosphoribosyltransferase [Methanohalobium evestigatum]ADI73775.1 orotate phosphoribosyltransferase [Methanohalobium evestigatum Z-7303]